MPSWRLRSRSGQAAPEYVAVLAVVGTVFAGAGAVVAAPDLPIALARQVRLALCVVGGDICRAADAERAGLEPCDVGGESHERHDSITVGIRAGRGKAWSVQRRSDGTAVLTAAEGVDGSAEIEVGVNVGPVDVHAGAAGGVAFQSGRVWELPDDATASRLLARLRKNQDMPAPTYRFLAGGDLGELHATAETAIGGASAGIEAARLLGRRVGRGRTTWYLDLGGGGSVVVPDLVGETNRSVRWVAEYEEGDPPVLTMRGTTDGPGAGRETVTTASLKLIDPADRAAAVRLLALNLPVPAASIPDALRLRQRLARSGTVQRLTYETTEQRDVTGASTAHGVKLGFERETRVSRRRLITAHVLGKHPIERKDCTGV